MPNFFRPGAVFVGCVALLMADGGTLVLRKQAGPLTISVFSTPEPLRVGPADLSVLVQKSAGNDAVLDAQVKLHLTHSSPEGIAEVFAPAIHKNATNKLLYAARVNFPSQGDWKLSATVESKDGSAEVAGNVMVAGRQPAIVTYWPYFGIVPVLVILFLINQWLRSRRRVIKA